MVTQVPEGGLTSVEQALADHVRSGEWLDLAADDEVVDQKSMGSWGDSRTCRAIVIRDILRARLVADPDPHGLRLRGARISGRIDLENLITDVNLQLHDCLLEEGILARGARMPSVILKGCQIEHPGEPPLDAERLTCSVFSLAGARIIGHAAAGAVVLAGAHIGGQFSCGGANLRNDSGPALSASGLQVGLDIDLSGFTATGSGGSAAVDLAGAHIGGRLIVWAKLRNDLSTALLAERLQVDQGMFLEGEFTGSGLLGAVYLAGAHIGGRLLSSEGAKLRNGSGPALRGSGLQVGQDMILTRGFTATGSGKDGAVVLAGARIGGQLSCDGAKLFAGPGPALLAFRLEVGQDMYLTGGFTATGSSRDGAVNLAGARIGGNLDCAGAVVRNRSGPALSASGLQVDQAMYLTGGFTATGSRGSGAVVLAGARIGGQLSCAGAVLRNGSGPALSAGGLQVGRDVDLTGGFSATGSRDVAVDLTGMHVGGTLRVDPVGVEHAADSQRRIAVDGLTYAGVPALVTAEDAQVSARAWLRLLREGTSRYSAQPYQQLAAGYRALGAERQAREVLMAQRDDQLTRTHPRWPDRVWGRITKVTLGYGYQPWRALLFLTAVAVLSCVLAVVLGSHGALAQTGNTAAPGRPCTVIQQVSVGLDLNLPVGTSLARADCGLAKDPASTAAAWLIAAGWVLRVLAWVFAALFIAGFTGAVRKT